MVVCDPNIYGGNLVQTLFLGATVVNFSATLGWNSSPTEVQVTLVEDKCSSVAGKVYYDGCSNPQIHYGPDYFNPPPLGYPVLFRFGSFYFCGVLQNWKYITDSNGRKISVRVTSPHEVLSGTSIILDGYNGPVFNIPNLINVYSFLEQQGLPVIYDVTMHTFLGYTPVTGYGGSYKNSAGIPWNLIKSALTYIVNSPAVWGQGYGQRMRLRDVSYYLDISELPYLNDYRVSGDSKDLLSLIAEICDVINKDFFLELRLSTLEGGVSCVGNTFSEVGDIAGRLNTNLLAFIKIRTVSRVDQPVPARLIDTSVDIPLEARLDQGAITSYAGSLETQNLDRGIELRPEITNAVVVGDNRQDIFEIPFISWGPNPTSSISSNTEPHYHNTTIFHYWGKDENGYPLPCRGMGGKHIVWFNVVHKFDPTTETVILDTLMSNVGYAGGWYDLTWRYTYSTSIYSDETPRTQYYNWQNEILEHNNIQAGIWEAKFSNPVLRRRKKDGTWVDYLQGSVQITEPYAGFVDSYQVYNGTHYPIEAAEMCAACVGVEEWSKWMQNAAPRWKRTLFSRLVSTSAFGKYSGINWLLTRLGIMRRPNRSKASILARAINSGYVDVGEGGGDSRTGAEKLYEYIKGLVDSYFGKKFIVAVNDLRVVSDNESPFGSRPNYSVTQDGWTDQSSILGLDVNSNEISLFKDEETGKLHGFAVVDVGVQLSLDYGLRDSPEAYFSSYLDFSAFNPDDYILINNYSAYVKFTVDEIIYMDPITKAKPRVVISFPERIFSSAICVNSVGDGTGQTHFFKRSWKDAVSLRDSLGRPPGYDAISMGTAAFPAFPWLIALPLKSNELSYGPWIARSSNNYYIADANKTSYIKDNSLNPWNFGNTANMNAAGQILVNSKIVKQNVIEFGNFTLPGLPRFTIGDIAISSGPELTELTMNLSAEGMTTTYGMKTYTPNYGTLGKIRVDQIQKTGSSILKNATSIQKSQIEGKTWTKAGKSPYSRMLARDDAKTRSSSQSFIIADTNTDWVPQGLMNSTVWAVYGEDTIYWNGTGWTLEDYYAAGGSVYDNGAKFNNVAISDVRKCLPEFEAHDDTLYVQKAGMCTEGLFRPYSTWQDDPNFAGFTYWDNFQEVYDPVKYYDYSDNVVRFGLTPVSGAGLPPINSWTMSPFPEGSGIDMDINVPNFKMALTYNGHDIEYVVRDGTYPMDLSVRSPYDNYSADGWYRAVGVKTPLVLVGWGYDVDGYPVPNKTPDNPGAYFEDDWLRRPHHWKSGPLDVRWDDDRGVWTAPMPFSVVRIQVVTTATAGGGGYSTFVAKILDDVIAYDKDGTIIENKIIVRNYTTTVVAVNDILYAKYSPNGKYGEPNFTKYELISSPQQTVGGTTVYTILTTGGSSNVGASGLITQSTTVADSLIGSGCILISGPDISGYSYLAFRSYPNPNCPEIRMTPYSAPNPIVDATVVSATTANLTSYSYLRTILNTMNLPNALPCSVQWNGNNWITVNSQCYNAPVLDIS